jgi:hypothetical protein
VILEIVASAVAGGLGGMLLLAAFDPRGVTNMDGLAIAIGILVAVGINRLVRG